MSQLLTTDSLSTPVFMESADTFTQEEMEITTHAIGEGVGGVLVYVHQYGEHIWTGVFDEWTEDQEVVK